MRVLNFSHQQREENWQKSFTLLDKSEEKCKETNSILDYNDGETNLICKISDYEFSYDSNIFSEAQESMSKTMHF